MKTSRFLGLVALATLTLGSCSNDEVVNDYSQDNAIEFGTYVGRGVQSRGSVYTTATVADEGFGVFAFYTDNGKYGEGNYQSFNPNFMKNQQVKGTVEEGETPTYTWSYTPVKYWPNESTDYLSFLAYAPYDENYVLGTDNTISFSVASEVKEQIDFLYCSNASELKNMPKPSVDSKVLFQFDHALTRVGFKAKLMVDKVNPDENGTKDDTDDNNTVFDSEHTTVAISQINLSYPVTKGDFNIETGKWNRSFTFEHPTIYTLGADELNSEAEDIENESTTGDIINEANSYLMLVPVQGQIQNGCWVEVTYTVTTDDPSLDDGKIAITNVVKAPFNYVGLFEQGKAYNLVLHIGLTSVKVEAEVEEWDEETTDLEINVPNNNEPKS